MGDRCSMDLYMRKSDFEALSDDLKEEIGIPYSEEDGGTVVQFSIDEVNYGAHTEREGWGEKGLVFYGSHGAGGDYGEYVFAAYDGMHIDCPASEGSPTVMVQDDGEIRSDEIRHAKQYLETYRKARLHIHVSVRIKELMDMKGLESESLEILVNECKAKETNALNSSGVDEQLSYLLANYVPEEILNHVKSLT